MALEEITVQITDLNDLSFVLTALQSYLYAEDLKTAQLELRNHRPSPLAMEVDQAKRKVDSYIQEFALRRYQAELEEDDPEDEEELEEPEEGSESVSEVSEEVLPSAPLGDFNPPRQQGRRLKADEV